MDLVWVCILVGLIGFGVVAFFIRYVLSQEQGSEKIRETSRAIQEGAKAFIGREYRTLAIVVVVITIILAVVPVLGWKVSVSFIFGAICSMGAGYAGMNIAIKANSRTCAAAQKSLNQGLRVSFRGGAVMGLTVVSIGIIGISFLYIVWHTDSAFLAIIPAYGTGASLVALFARVGGGIFTKGADSGADLVGKVEVGIPEDDPRNAAVIADFVGDNVGDVAGMGADLFESYVESIVATMAVALVATGAIAVGGKAFNLVPNIQVAWWLPLLVRAGGIIASIIGCFIVKVGEKPQMSALLAALRRGTNVAIVLAAFFSFLIINALGASIGVFWAVLAGLVAGALVGESTTYYTSYAYSPTLKISKSSTSGAGATIVRGFANGLISTWAPVLLIVAAMIVAYKFAGIYGVAMADIGLLSTLGITLATDAYGPIADNAGGIATMVGLTPEVRERTDALDSLGNTTAATGKGFAICGAALTSVALLLAYILHVEIEWAELSLLDIHIIAGVFIGTLMPAVFCAMTMNSVGITTELIVAEVRRQWREIKGIQEGTASPEYGKCVDIATKAALKQMLAPSLMAIIAPIIVGIILGRYALAGFLIGSIASGLILAITLNNAGGSWDNAKKWIEAGNFGGKGSDAHKAAVVGDTVGDPMKDTAGPSLNILIKLMSVISLMLAPVLIHFNGLL
jgi:K(+)-stimulated pyrophosphate-energized sodium pump